MARPATVLQVNTFPPAIEARLHSAFDVARLPTEEPTRSEVLERVASRVRGIATSSLGPVSESLIRALPALEIIACFSTGTDGIDTAFAQSRGIPVTNSGAVVAPDVADVVVGLIIGIGRAFPLGDEFVRQGLWQVTKGQWSNGNYPLGHSLRGRRIGLFGFGRIGRETARRLAGFPVELGYCARSARADVDFQYFPNALALAEWSDVLVVCVPGGAATRHLVNAAVLEALGPQGVLINVGRGSVVDEVALTTALETGVIAGAGLDVFETEPKVSEALRATKNTILLPHISSATEETRLAMGNSMIDALLARLGGVTASPASARIRESVAGQ